MSRDPLKEDIPATQGKTFGKAGAEDDERVDDLVDETDDLDEAAARFRRESSVRDVEGPHPPADAGDRVDG